MGHVSFPWSYIFWSSTSSALPRESNPTPTTKIKIAIFTSSILAEGNEHFVPVAKISSKNWKKNIPNAISAVLPILPKTTPLVCRMDSSRLFAKKCFPIRCEGHLSSAGVSPTPMWVVHHLPPTAPEKSLHALESTRESKRVHLLQSFGMKMPTLFET